MCVKASVQTTFKAAEGAQMESAMRRAISE